MVSIENNLTYDISLKSEFQYGHDEHNEHCFWFTNEAHIYILCIYTLQSGQNKYEMLEMCRSHKLIQSLLPVLSKIITKTALDIPTATAENDHPRNLVCAKFDPLTKN